MRVSFVAVVALASLAIAGHVTACASDQDGGSLEALKRKPGAIAPPSVPTGSRTPMTRAECTARHGTIVPDDACPSTTSDVDGGGKLEGRFRCRTSSGDEGVCINVDQKAI